MPKVIQHNSKVCDLKCLSNCEFAVTTEQLNLVKKKKMASLFYLASTI